jgi:protein phosphatase
MTRSFQEVGLEGAKLHACALSDVGRVRSRNEDAYLLMAEQNLFVVADGMGGHQRGDVASALCIDAIRDWFTGKVSDETMTRLGNTVRGLLGRPTPGETDLVAAIEFANRIIFEMSTASSAFRGMGTTVVASYFHGSTLFVVFSGDSRIYRLRKGHLHVLSSDHSLLNEYLRLKMIHPSEARSFPHRNVIMKALGLRERADVEFFRRRVMPGDVYLLCSDGLNDMLEDEVIEAILNQGGSLSQRTHRLIDAALVAGGVDNVTVSLIET